MNRNDSTISCVDLPLKSWIRTSACQQLIYWCGRESRRLFEYTMWTCIDEYLEDWRKRKEKKVGKRVREREKKKMSLMGWHWRPSSTEQVSDFFFQYLAYKTFEFLTSHPAITILRNDVALGNARSNNRIIAAWSRAEFLTLWALYLFIIIIF